MNRYAENVTIDEPDKTLIPGLLKTNLPRIAKNQNNESTPIIF